MHEAKIEPAGRIYDVMTAIWLTDGRRPSLGEAVAINYGLSIPKTLGASDWSADSLTPEQLEYAALDAVLCHQLWLTQQTELFDDIDKQCQELADAVTLAIARMELHGMPIDIGAHRKQVDLEGRFWRSPRALYVRPSPRRDLQMPAELQAHLRDVLDDDELAAWPRTGGGKLATRRQQLQLSSDLPGIAELLQVRALRKLIEFIWRHSDQRDQSCNGPAARQLSDCGREHRPLRRGRTEPQQMPKARQRGFRKIFVAPPGQVVMALDYSQIELRAVAELINDWFGTDSILRGHFAAGLDAHTATAMTMAGKANPQDVTPEERQLAKPANFGLLYRIGENGFYNYVRANFLPDVTLEEACDLRAKFFAGYPDLARWQDEYARACREQGYTQTVAGRRWRWRWQAQEPEDLDEDAPFYADKVTGFRGSYAVNHPVQGSSAEVMMIALTRLDKALRGEPVQLIATVHDEVVLLAPDDPAAVERIGAIVQQEMIAAFLEVFPDAPTLNVVDPAVGPTWGDLRPLRDWVAERRSRGYAAAA